MAISGGIKLFDKSQNLLVDGASITATSGSDGANRAIDRNSDSYWRSVLSNDATTETLEVSFPSSKTITRLLLLDHNWKGFNVQYDNSGVWTHFSSVVGLDGSKANITETAFSDDTAYYEFASVTTTKIRIQVTTTQTVNAQKYISQIIATSELGTLQGYPDVDPEISKNSREKQVISGKYLIQKSKESFHITLGFKEYPTSSTYNPDLELMFTIFDRDDPFIIWICGGRRGTSYFRYALRGFRLRDAITVQVSKAYKPSYANNIYTGQATLKIDLREHV